MQKPANYSAAVWLYRNTLCRNFSVYDVWRNVGLTSLAGLGLWLLEASDAAEAHLAFGELVLVGLVAVAFVLLWINLGEVISLLRTG